ncbi:MAG: hypothetical protein DHS20C21_06850 [Gemmatimonadota bacterium]|nr:MAG: hypothetical protein DHS20C21_06850 [Gemmatimonadota bacterium]
MDVAGRIDRLFVEDEPALDESGVLALLAAALGDLQPRTLAVVRSSGAIDRIHPIGDSGPSAAEIRAVVARVLRSPAPAGDSWVVRSSDVDAVLVVCCDRPPHQVPAERRQELDWVARGALRTLAQHDEGRRLGRRITQLQNELAALNTSHDSIVTELLETKEEQSRQQRESVERLEAEVDRRSSALREALHQAELASQTKSSFLANMSHELRTPLTAILGYADLLSEPGLSPQEIAAHADVIRSNGWDLLNVMNDVLDVAKIESRALRLEESRFSLGDLLRGVAAEFEPRAVAKGLRLIAPIDAPSLEMVSDHQRVRQILHNLLDNAVKFTETGEIRIRLESRRVGAVTYVSIAIRDTGIGMDAAEVEGLFETFTQLDSSSTRRFGGTGLGLSISRNLARLLGGDITVSSEPGRGSTFRVMLRQDTSTAGVERPEEGAGSRELASPWRQDAELMGFLNEFLDSVPQRLNQVQRSSSAGDWAESGRESESLRQEAETVGLEALRRVADDLVQAAAKKDVPALFRSVNAARELLPRVPRN